MLSRRTFLGAIGTGFAASGVSFAEAPQRKKLAIITTEWRVPTHAWHMGERFLVGYPVERTLLTSGLVEANIQSLDLGKHLETPYLNVRYEAPRNSTFSQS